MTTVALHYDLHLAEHYSWLFGGLPERVAENRAFFESIGLRGERARALDGPRGERARALDIGAGSGFQSIPLARLGFSVVAVDLSERLLAERRASAGDLPIQTVRDDILACIEPMTRASFDACVCMGDTLTHLQSFGDVQRLLREAHRVLAPGARFVVSIRDYSAELQGDARFIPVRADERTIFSCFLEYEGDHVRVYDIVQARTDAGWDMRVSSYKKLRIAPDWLEKRLRESGFEVLSRSLVSGFVTIDARRA